METHYELWDFDTGNAVGEYPSLKAALGVVRGAIGRDGESTLEGLALLEVTADGREMVAEERELLRLIEADAAAS